MPTFARRISPRLRGVALLLFLYPAAPATAAEITAVADAADGDDPYDARVELLYSRTLRRAKVTREFNCNFDDSPDTCPSARPGVGEMVYAKELRVQRWTHALTPRAELGIWHDLALRVEMPIVLDDTQEVRFAGDGGDPDGVAVDGQISTIAPDALPGETENPPDLFPVPPQLPTRAGFGDMSLSLRWSPFNQERDEARATWTLFFTWGLPTGKIMRPGNDGVGRGLHTLTLGTAMSRRFEHVDPYFSMSGSLYVPSSSSMFKDYKFAQEEIGPGGVGTFEVGAEIVPFEQVGRRYVKIFLDLGLGAEYHAEGRNYTDLFDAFAFGGRNCALGEAAPRNVGCYNPDSNSELHGQAFDGITTVEQFGVVRGHLGLGAYFSQYVKFMVDLSLAHETEHFASSADVGKDLDGSGLVENRDDPDFNADEQNPTYVAAIDAAGRRLRFEETTVFTLAIGLGGQF
jgi:hypothetical protein